MSFIESYYKIALNAHGNRAHIAAGNTTEAGLVHLDLFDPTDPDSRHNCNDLTPDAAEAVADELYAAAAEARNRALTASQQIGKV